MDKYQIAELLNDLKNRIEEIESRFKIKRESGRLGELWLENTRLALQNPEDIKKGGSV